MCLRRGLFPPVPGPGASNPARIQSLPIPIQVTRGGSVQPRFCPRLFPSQSAPVFPIPRAPGPVIREIAFGGNDCVTEGRYEETRATRRRVLGGTQVRTADRPQQAEVLVGNVMSKSEPALTVRYDISVHT